MARVFPLSESDSLDLRNGSVVKVYTVQHVTTVASDLWVDQSAVSAAVLPSKMTASGDIIAQEASESAGISLTDNSATDGVKEVTLASGVGTGTYFIAVRFIGSGAGVG